MTDPTTQLVPPWARFPDFEHLCLGWRMGIGESYLSTFWAAIERVPLEDREAYLRAHPPAPHTWFRSVWAVLGQEVPEDGALQTLIERGLVASDVAWSTWTRDVDWPWALDPDPVDAARYQTRTFAFLARHMVDDPRRADVVVPPGWEVVTTALRTGEPAAVDPAKGLEALAIFFCAGEVQGPWTLGMAVEDVQESFELDMNYADAFSLWMMAVFDDRPHFERELARLQPPEAWRAWMEAEVFLP